MGLIKQTTQETYQKGMDIPAISPILDRPTSVSVNHAPMNKDKRILVQGILQAVIQSQGLLLEPNDGYIKHVKAVTLDLVKFVEENSR